MSDAHRQHLTDLTNVDLGPLLTHLSGQRSKRERNAKSPETRLLLQAGLQLIEEHFAAPPNLDNEEVRHQAFKWISAPKVADLVVENHPGAGRSVEYWSRTKAARWVNHDGFIADLLNVALHTQHWSVGVAEDHESLKPLVEGLQTGDFVESVRELAYLDISGPIHSPSIQRMEFLAVAMCEREPAFKPVLQSSYRAVDAVWDKLYTEIFSARGWRPRPDFTLQELNLILSTAAVGMAMRGAVSPAGIIDDDTRNSLLGKLCLALVAGCVDSGDGRSLDQVVRDLVEGKRVQPDRTAAQENRT